MVAKSRDTAIFFFRRQNVKFESECIRRIQVNYFRLTQFIENAIKNDCFKNINKTTMLSCGIIVHSHEALILH